MTFICGLAPSELLQRATPSYSVWGHGIYAWGGQGRETVTHTPKVGVSHHRTLRSLPPFQPGPATYLWGPVQNANLGPPCSNIIISGWPQQSVKPSTQLRRSHARDASPASTTVPFSSSLIPRTCRPFAAGDPRDVEKSDLNSTCSSSLPQLRPGLLCLNQPLVFDD